MNKGNPQFTSWTYEGDIAEATKWLPYAVGMLKSCAKRAVARHTETPANGVMITVDATTGRVHIKAGLSGFIITVALGLLGTLDQIDSTLFLNEKKLKSKFAPYSPAYITTLLDSEAKEHDLATSPPLPTSEGGGDVTCISYNRSDTDELISFTGPHTSWNLLIDLADPRSGACAEYQGRRFWGRGEFCFDARVKGGFLFMLTGFAGWGYYYRRYPEVNLYVVKVSSYAKKQSHDLDTPVFQKGWTLPGLDGFLGAVIAPECNEFSVLFDRATPDPQDPNDYAAHTAELNVFAIQNVGGEWTVAEPVVTEVKTGNVALKFTDEYTKNDPGQYTHLYSSFFGARASICNKPFFGGWPEAYLTQDTDVVHFDDSYSVSQIYFGPGRSKVWTNGFTKSWTYSGNPPGSTTPVNYTYTRYLTFNAFTGDYWRKTASLSVTYGYTRNGEPFIPNLTEGLQFPPGFDASEIVELNAGWNFTVGVFCISKKLIENPYLRKVEPIGDGYYVGLTYDDDKNSPTYNSVKFLEYKWDTEATPTIITYRHFLDNIDYGSESTVYEWGVDSRMSDYPEPEHPAYAECLEMVAANIPRRKIELEVSQLGRATPGIYLDGVLLSRGGYWYDHTIFADLTYVKRLTYVAEGFGIKLAGIENHYGDTDWLAINDPQGIPSSYWTIAECANYPNQAFGAWGIDEYTETKYTTVDVPTEDIPLCTLAAQSGLRERYAWEYAVNGMVKKTTHYSMKTPLPPPTKPPVYPYIPELFFDYPSRVYLLPNTPWWVRPTQAFIFEIAEGVYLISVSLYLSTSGENYTDFKRNKIWLEYADGTKIMDIDTIKTATGLTNINNVDNLNYRVVLGTSNII